MYLGLFYKKAEYLEYKKWKLETIQIDNIILDLTSI